MYLYSSPSLHDFRYILLSRYQESVELDGACCYKLHEEKGKGGEVRGSIGKRNCEKSGPKDWDSNKDALRARTVCATRDELP